ncbi:hypothetical protein IL306_005972, partial [Fusarium sp. DS 682]
MEIAPLQVYASALVFSPIRSLIRELFEKEEPNWITLKPSVESDWNACLQTFEGHDDSVTSVAFSADGQQVASGSGDKTIKIWDTATGACVQTLYGHSAWVNSVAFSADSQQVASGSNDKTVKIWDVATDTCVQTLRVGRVITYLLFDPRTNSLLSTDIGLLNLDLPVLPPAIDNGSTDATLQSVRHSGWG